MKVVQGEQEEDYWNEVKVSSELGDYNFLQYRCEKDLDPELEWEQHSPQEQQAKEDWLAEQQEKEELKEFRTIQREEADWLTIQEENAQSRDLQGEEEWRKIQLQDQLDEEQEEEELRKVLLQHLDL